MRHLVWLALIAISASSCIDNKDYQIHSADVTPSLALPLVNGPLSIQNILNKKDSAYVKIDSDDVVYLSYSQTLVSQDIRNLFNIPDKAINQSFALAPGVIPAHSNSITYSTIPELIDFGLNPEQLSLIDFKSGTITYSTTLLPSNPNLQYEVVLSSANFVSRTTGQTLSITTSASGTVDLSDYKLTLDKNRFNLNMQLILKPSSTPVTIAHNSSVAVSFAMSSMNYNMITGFFGDQTVTIKPTTLNIGAFGTALNKSNISFANPTVTLDVINDYGIPCQVSFVTFQAKKATGNGLDVQLNPANPITIASPTTIGTSATTPVSVTNSKDLLDYAPTSFYYSVKSTINPNITSGNNFLADTSKLRVRLGVNIPLYGHAQNIVMADTTSISLGNVDKSTIAKASLKVNIVNELPLGATVQFYLTDSKHIIIDSLLNNTQTKLIAASSVNANGDLQTAGTVDQLLPLDATALNAIFQAKYIIVKAVMSTSKDASGNTIDVKFKSKYTMQVALGLLADLNINITF